LGIRSDGSLTVLVTVFGALKEEALSRAARPGGTQGPPTLLGGPGAVA
jgi:hypothetical protein